MTRLIAREKFQRIYSLSKFEIFQIFLVSGPVGTNDRILVRSKTICAFGIWASSSTRAGIGLSETNSGFGFRQIDAGLRVPQNP
jgi:hypothetical protein